jgi:hypothetical protein
MLNLKDNLEIWKMKDMAKDFLWWATALAMLNLPVFLSESKVVT